MNARRSYRDPGPRAAAAVRVRAQRIVRETFDRLGPADRTVTAKILVTRFVERCAQSAAAGDWSALSRWTDATCERYEPLFPAQRVLSATLEQLAHALSRTTDEYTARAFERARNDVFAVLAKPRANGATNLEAVDETDVVLDALINQLDQSDPLTAEHSRAVASWCARLAKRLGGSKDEVTHLTRAGLIHDIGKVTTPAAILSAPRRLDDEEMSIMRRHAEEGEAIVREVPLIVGLAPAVRNHHERFDGNGYPDRLRWETIPRDARIVAVADSFNAMIGRRPYRPPMAPSAALEQLVAGRGNQFDPDVVDAMIDVVTERG